MATGGGGEWLRHTHMNTSRFLADTRDPPPVICNFHSRQYCPKLSFSSMPPKHGKLLHTVAGHHHLEHHGPKHQNIIPPLPATTMRLVPTRLLLPLYATICFYRHQHEHNLQRMIITGTNTTAALTYSLQHHHSTSANLTTTNSTFALLNRIVRINTIYNGQYKTCACMHSIMRRCLP